jgi:hypothetical protein
MVADDYNLSLLFKLKPIHQADLLGPGLLTRLVMGLFSADHLACLQVLNPVCATVFGAELNHVFMSGDCLQFKRFTKKRFKEVSQKVHGNVHETGSFFNIDGKLMLAGPNMDDPRPTFPKTI